tara:strand:- start:5 stop:805 length:801 start_codon:yes stop_codon:yes gene_type:complete
MPKVYGYIRASTAGQHLTHEAQRKTILTNIAPLVRGDDAEYEFGDIFQDKATSGKTPLFERPQGILLFAAMKPGDMVVWSKLDRAFRNTLDFCETAKVLTEKNIGFFSCDLKLDSRTPLGKYIYTTLAALAELEREWISTRTKEALAQESVRLMPTVHRPPPGWRKLPEDQWEKDYAERKLIDWVERQRARHQSFRAIASHLKANKVKRACGSGYTRKFLMLALYAKLLNYPHVSNWQKTIKAEALQVMNSGGSLPNDSTLRAIRG